MTPRLTLGDERPNERDDVYDPLRIYIDDPLRYIMPP